MITSFEKSLLASLFQREDLFPFIKRGVGCVYSPLWQRGEKGDFSEIVHLLICFSAKESTSEN